MNNNIENLEILGLPYVTIKSHRFGRLRICVEVQKEKGSFF